MTFLDLAAPAAWSDPPGAAPALPPNIRARVRRGAEATVDTVRRLVFPVHGIAP
jgi:hypothetical protein